MKGGKNMNKKELILMVLMFGILVGVSALVSAANTCTENDGGYKIYVQGTATGTDSLNNPFSLSDVCNGNVLTEYVCNLNGNLNPPSSVTCTSGCNNGACILPCSDSDGGKDYQTKGEVTQTPGMTISDFCHDSNLLIEGYCDATQKYASKNYNCPNGCSDGVCVSGGISSVGPAEASAGSVAKTGTRTSSTGTKTSTSSAKKSSGSKTCPTSWTETTSTDGTACCIPKSGRATGRFLGFMFRD